MTVKWKLKYSILSLIFFLFVIFEERNLINIFDIYLENKIFSCKISLDVIYTLYFIIFYYVYLKILRFKIYIENRLKSKWKEQKEMKLL